MRSIENGLKGTSNLYSKNFRQRRRQLILQGKIKFFLPKLLGFLLMDISAAVTLKVSGRVQQFRW